MKQRLLNHIASIEDPALRATCDETILLCPKFDTCPASLSFHHAYEGGLLAHTVEVCDLALRIWDGFHGTAQRDHNKDWQWINIPKSDTLLAAALFHDLMKIEEYERSETAAVSGIMWKHTDNYGKQIGHICGSAAQFQATAFSHGVSHATVDAVVHCILAHHGRKEWGSPVEPQTKEALILHQADMLSAKFGVTKNEAP